MFHLKYTGLHRSIGTERWGAIAKAFTQPSATFINILQLFADVIEIWNSVNTGGWRWLSNNLLILNGRDHLPCQLGIRAYILDAVLLVCLNNKTNGEVGCSSPEFHVGLIGRRDAVHC